MSSVRSATPLASEVAPAGGAAVGAVLERLAAIHGAAPHRIRRLWQMAGRDAFERRAAASSICADGTPFELSVTVGGGAGGLRYLTELGDGDRGRQRLADARRRLPALIDLLDLPRRPFLDRIDALLPRPRASFPELSFGLWVCPVLLAGASRLKVYVNTSWWQSCGRRLRALGWCGALPRNADLPWPPAFVGLENTARGPGRIKLYFRGRPVSRARALALASREEAAGMTELWRELLGDRELVDDAVLSIRRTGAGAPDVKLDVPAGALALAEVEIARRVEAAAERLRLDAGAYRRTLELGGLLDGGWSHTVLGLSAAAGRPRITAYLKPVLRDPRSLSRVVRAVLSTLPAYAEPAGER